MTFDFAPGNNDPSSRFHKISSTFAKMRHIRSKLRGCTSTPGSIGPVGRFAASPRTPQDNFRDNLEAVKARDSDQFKPTFNDKRYIRRHFAYLCNEHDTLVETTLRGTINRDGDTLPNDSDEEEEDVVPNNAGNNDLYGGTSGAV